jgi:hypothetical protein
MAGGTKAQPINGVSQGTPPLWQLHLDGGDCTTQHDLLLQHSLYRIFSGGERSIPYMNICSRRLASPLHMFI